jgi:prevent-host-death family protein
MAKYSVATTRNNLSSLIDKALAGEEVVITRHGKPKVSLSVVSEQEEAPRSKLSKAERIAWMDRLERLRESMPKPKESFLEGKRIEQEEWESRFDR